MGTCISVEAILVYLCDCWWWWIVTSRSGSSFHAAVKQSKSLPRICCCCCCWSISQGQSGLQGFLLCTAQGTIEYSGIPLQVVLFVRDTCFRSLLFTSPVILCRGSDQCTVRLSSATTTNSRCSRHGHRHRSLSTSSTPVVLSASDLSPRRRTLHSHPPMSTPDVTANTTSTHHLTKAWSRTVTRSCHSSHEAWQQQ